MRKSETFIIMLCAALAGAAGCSNLDEDAPVQDGCVTIIEVNAGVSPQQTDSTATKTGISGSLGGSRQVLWSEGDCLSLDGTASEPLAAEYAGTSSAKFIWNAVPSEGRLLYPASFWKDASTLTLPYAQDKMPGEDDIADGTLPMCGIAQGGAASLNHLCAILRIQWVRKSAAADSTDICYLEFRGRNDEQVSGEFAVDYTNATLTAASSAPESRYVRAYSMKSVGADTAVCNIVVPAGTYSKGFYARLVDKRGYYMDAYTSKSKTLAAGTVVTMPCFKYNPSTKLNALTPSTAGELLAIAREWNSGKYEGGAANVCLASDIEFSEEQSAEWNALGGLGTDEVPYKGTFDGKDFAIKGLEGSTPFFGNVGAEGTVQNIKIDSSCTFSCTPLVCTLSGKMSLCSNYADITLVTDLADTAILGGFASRSLEGAVISGCNNYAALTVSSSNVGNTAPSYIGGIVGYAFGTLDIQNCTNEGFIHCSYDLTTKVNGRPSCIGGIVGRSDGEGTVIRSCTGTGAIYNHNWNNSADLSGPVSGGIVGAVLGAENSNVTISGCKVLGPDQLQTQRGTQGGIVGYASYAAISDCYFSKQTTSATTNIPSNLGGICGKALSSTISGCTVEDALLCCKTTINGPVGGICGYLGSTSKALDNSALRIKIARNAPSGFTFGGVVGAVESESSEISGNSFGGKSSTDGGYNWTAFTENDVCSSASFAVNTPNTLVDSPVDLSGVVLCGSSPLEGVVVTDGYQSVRTDLNGRFHLTGYASKSRFVSVCLPEGYAAPVKNGLPVFYVKTGGEPKDDISFNLSKIDNPDRFSVFVTADPQQRSSGAGYDNFAYHSSTCSSNVYEAVGKRAGTITDRRVYGIVLGDVVHENMSLYSNQKKDLANYCSAMSTYHIIGNHDYNPSAKDIVAGMADFESNFGPVNYSMNIGRFHFIMLNDIQSKLDTDGRLRAYDTGLTDDQIAWLQSDLQYVPISTPLVVCAHAPLFAKHSGGNKSVTFMEGKNLNCAAYKALLAKYSNVYVLAGHMHNGFTYVYSKEKPSETSLKGVQCLQIARCAGALWINEYLNTDGTPRGYLQMDMDGTSVSWKYILDVPQTSAFSGKYNGTSYSAPSYDYRDWNYSSGVPVLKSGGKVDENYQMKLYADQGGCLWANIFFWDALWETPVMSYTNSSGAISYVQMPRVALSAGPYDFSYDFYNKYYAEHNANWKESSGTALNYSPHMFKCTMPADCPSQTATVSVTDRFGNNWSSSISW